MYRVERLLAVAAINTYTKALRVKEDGAARRGGAFMDGRAGCSDKRRTFQSTGALKISIYSLHAVGRIGVCTLRYVFKRVAWTNDEDRRNPSRSSKSLYSTLSPRYRLGKRRRLTRKMF